MISITVKTFYYIHFKYLSTILAILIKNIGKIINYIYKKCWTMLSIAFPEEKNIKFKIQRTKRFV